MKMTLGETLKQSRELATLTLRQVEEVIGVSNAYLSMLENGKIKKPSANVLYKLSSLYKVSLDDLLYAAGIILETPDKKDGLLGQIRHMQALTPEEEQRLLEYLNFLRNKPR